MVIHQLEKDLGDFVIDQSLNRLDQSEDTLALLNVEINNSNNKTIASDLVESAYFDEVFALAITMSNDTPYNEKLKKLKIFCHNLGLYKIRNAVCHPNRPFPESFWHRAATIATDELIDQIGLPNVFTQFKLAEEGKIESPPDDWFAQAAWQMPNNLPNNFDHDVTGFVGRKTDIKDLKHHLCNPRQSLVASVGPGGTGKTALALSVLKDLSLSPSSLDIADGIVFVSLKNEKLTHQGIQKLNAAETIDKLIEELILSIAEVFDCDLTDSLDLLIDSLSNKKMLICIDNLETLLRDRPENFYAVIDKFPRDWRVLVTSRVDVNSATTLPLDKLKPADSLILARSYSIRRNLTHLGESEFEKTSIACKNNPLAIRLTIDAVSAGLELQGAIGKVVGEVTEFSYKNLISSLSIETIKTLELLFINDGLSRVEMADLLNFNLDEVAATLLALRKTSLILVKQEKDHGHEFYALNDSVRDLLATNPTNIEVRNSLAEEINKKRSKISEIQSDQKKFKIDKLHHNFIPDNIPENLQILIKETYQLTSRKRKDFEKLTILYKQYLNASELYSGEGIFWTSFSRISTSIADHSHAKACLREAIEIDSNDLQAKKMLAFCYRSEGSYDEAVNLSLDIITQYEAEDNLNNDDFYIRVKDIYFSSLLWGFHYKRIEDETKNWKKSAVDRGIQGCFRTLALKRMSEKEKDKIKRINLLKRASAIMMDVIVSDGIFYNSIEGSRNLLKEISSIQLNYSIPIDEETQLVFNNFAHSCYSQMQFSDPEIKNYFAWIAQNADKDGRFSSFQKNIEKDSPYHIDQTKDLVKVKVYSIPNSGTSAFPTFVFAEDDARNQYFIKFDCLKNAYWLDWKKICVGSILHVAPGMELGGGKAIPCIEVYLDSL